MTEVNNAAGHRNAVRAGLLAIAALVALGVLAGLAWWKWAPVAQVRVQAGDAYYVDPVADSFVRSDLLLAACLLVLGLVAGLVVRRLVRSNDLLVVVSLAVGGTLASIIALLLGQFLGRIDTVALLSKPDGTLSPSPLKLTAYGLLVLFPVAALGSWLAADLWRDFRRRGDPAPLPVYDYSLNWPVPPPPLEPPSAG